MLQFDPEMQDQAREEAIKNLKQKIEDCKGDMFLAYGYIKQLEEIENDKRSDDRG